MKKQCVTLHNARHRNESFGGYHETTRPLMPICRHDDLTDTEPEQIDVESCREIPILAVLAKAIDGVKLRPGDSDETIISKFGSLVVPLTMGTIAIRSDNYFFVGRPSDFVISRTWYGIHKTA